MDLMVLLETMVSVVSTNNVFGSDLMVIMRLALVLMQTIMVSGVSTGNVFGSVRYVIWWMGTN